METVRNRIEIVEILINAAVYRIQKIFQSYKKNKCRKNFKKQMMYRKKQRTVNSTKFVSGPEDGKPKSLQ